MNSKITISSAALFLAILGITLSFVPFEIGKIIGLDSGFITELFLQLTGSLYVGFAILNWMSRDTITGGIYNRPFSIANFSHFLIGGLAMIKGLIRHSGEPNWLWIPAMFYLVFAFLFFKIIFLDSGIRKKQVE